jgi:hypothetical protein
MSNDPEELRYLLGTRMTLEESIARTEAPEEISRYRELLREVEARIREYSA